MGKKKKLVDPIADVKKNPAKVTMVWINPAAASHVNDIYDPLPVFPTEIFACKNLVDIDIFRGLVDGRIPDEIGSLKKLRTLGLGGLDTTQLPESIGKLEKLEKLDLPYMEMLEALPESLGKLTKLQELTAPYCSVKSLPTSIGSCKALRIVSFSSGKLESVPASLWKCAALEELILPETLRSLPPGIGALKKLRRLAISPQALAGVVRELPKSLVEISVIGDYSGTSASELPELGHMPNLEQLDASYLGLTSLPASIAELESLVKLDVGGNKLSTLIDLVLQFPKLKYLDYSNNPIAAAERRELDKLMKLTPAKRKKLVPAKPPKPKSTKPKQIGQVASINASLSLIIADAKVAADWGGVGDDLDSSDWERARQALAKKDYAMVDVGNKSAVALSLGIGQGIAHVFRVGDRIVVVESIADDTEDELFLEYVASAPQKPKSVANIAVPSKKLVMVPTTENGDSDERLSIDVPAKISISIEPATKSSWGEGRRFFVTPA